MAPKKLIIAPQKFIPEILMKSISLLFLHSIIIFDVVAGSANTFHPADTESNDDDDDGIDEEFHSFSPGLLAGRSGLFDYAQSYHKKMSSYIDVPSWLVCGK